MIVAVPSATEVTRPVDDTVATAASDVVHVTVALAIVAPFWSLTVADSWDVAPSEARLRRWSPKGSSRSLQEWTLQEWTPLDYCLLHNSLKAMTTTGHLTRPYFSQYYLSIVVMIQTQD